MLENAFKLDSYFDYMLYTHIKTNDKGDVTSYNFVTERWNHYPARFTKLYKDILIPNDLENVISTVRKANGI